jgi:TonB family protein
MRERISIGPPIPAQQREPLVLHRDDDLTRVARGQADGAPGATTTNKTGPPPAGAEPTRPQETAVPAEDVRPLQSDGTWAASRARAPIPAGGSRLAGPGPIASSLVRLEAGGFGAPLGLPTGAGQQMGPLLFDPEGADFTAWINQFKNEVYRNWILPPAAEMGVRGQVALTFTVERGGALSAVAVTSTSGTPALDRAAEHALTGSRFLPLPADFRLPNVTMRVIFVYNGATVRS